MADVQEKKYLDLEGLKKYDALIKAYIGKGYEDILKELEVVQGQIPTSEDIAEQVAELLIPENAQESLDTLKEIAEWIQAHPEDAAAMNASIAALEEKVGKEAVEEESHEATEEDVEAGLAENVGDKVVDKEAEEATGIYKEIADLEEITDARLDAVEVALGLKGDDTEDNKSLVEQIADLKDEIEEVDAKVDAYVRITEEEVEALFLEDIESN